MSIYEKENNKPILIFDFGNVIIDIDYQRCYNNFCTLLEVDWDGKLPSEVKEWIVLFETGKITEETFLWKFQSTFNAQLNPRSIIDCWNSMLTGIPEGRLTLLGKIADKYDTYLLSNTNSIHLAWVRRYIKREHACTDFDTRYFKKTFYSHEIGMVKPNAEIYNYVTKQIACNASDIVFIDDLKENIEAANAYGWKGVLNDPQVGVEALFDGGRFKGDL